MYVRFFFFEVLTGLKDFSLGLAADRSRLLGGLGVQGAEFRYFGYRFFGFCF